MDDDRGRGEVVRAAQRGALVGEPVELGADDRRAARDAGAALGRLQAQVDRHGGRPEQQAAVQRLDERAPRRQRDPDAVAGPHAERAQPAGRQRRGVEQLGVRQRAVVGAQRDRIGARAGRTGQPGFDEHQ